MFFSFRGFSDIRELIFHSHVCMDKLADRFEKEDAMKVIIVKSM